MNDQIMQLSIIETTSDLLALRDEWDGLCVRGGSNHFFQSFSWCWHVWNSVAAVKGRMLHIVIGRQDAKLVLVWPLMTDGRKLRMLSSDTLEYRDLIVEVSPHAEYWMRMAWEFIKQTRRSDLLILQNLRYPSNINRLLNGTPGALAVGGGWCPVIRLNKYADWSSYAKHLPRSLISDQRRQWSRAREVLPGLSFNLIKDSEDIELTIHWILDQKLKWLRKKNENVTYFGSNEMQDFFAHISKAAHDKDSLVLAKLSDGETIISAGFGYRFKDEFLFHVFSYDMTWNKLSPSRLFLEELSSLQKVL